MIKKLRSKIFTLMMLSLSIIVIGVIILFATLNCNNAIHLARENIDRMKRMRDKTDFQQSNMKPEIQEYINQENEKVNKHIKSVIIFSCAASGLALIAIYAVSKNVARLIVKPVEDTLEKQKQFISDASHELKTPLAVIEANADSFIERLPNGYDTRLSGNGAQLSQGQRQLLSIARVAINNPPVMILDEATSSIDTRTEKIVQDGMDKLMEGRTVFVIAHRLSTVRNSKVIMAMEHGQIIERGNHEELMAEKGEYYQLYTGAFKLE